MHRPSDQRPRAIGSDNQIEASRDGPVAIGLIGQLAGMYVECGNSAAEFELDMILIVVRDRRGEGPYDIAAGTGPARLSPLVDDLPLVLNAFEGQHPGVEVGGGIYVAQRTQAVAGDVDRVRPVRV